MRLLNIVLLVLVAKGILLSTVYIIPQIHCIVQSYLAKKNRPDIQKDNNESMTQSTYSPGELRDRLPVPPLSSSIVNSVVL